MLESGLYFTEAYTESNAKDAQLASKDLMIVALQSKVADLQGQISAMQYRYNK